MADSMFASSLSEWLSVVLKRGVVTIKNRVIVQYSCEETFGALVKKVTTDFDEELRVKSRNADVISADQNFVDTHEVAVNRGTHQCL